MPAPIRAIGSVLFLLFGFVGQRDFRCCRRCSFYNWGQQFFRLFRFSCFTVTA